MSEAGESWRVFCAIEFPATVSQRASEHIRRLRQQVSDSSASWNRDEKFHLTIKFLGEIPRLRVSNLSSAAQRTTSNLSRFDLIVTGTGSFPPKGPPKVLWLGIDDPSGNLGVLHKHLEEECDREGFAREERAFRPHLTMARLRKPQGARELAAAHKEMRFSPVTFPVSELLVIRSELSSSGSKYTTVSRHLLN